MSNGCLKQKLYLRVRAREILSRGNRNELHVQKKVILLSDAEKTWHDILVQPFLWINQGVILVENIEFTANLK